MDRIGPNFTPYAQRVNRREKARAAWFGVDSPSTDPAAFALVTSVVVGAFVGVVACMSLGV